ncbi:hypothetical protein MLD38_009726 [Melastoma candidum]|uniref:Uncharacterized protein n=1 Tax=Melastoma candidum TaxID=119954 RepID=A0ACB9S002_9MYRT|nr:hypothetical protein MLD38_009726 [Melastoma candidum]
MAPLVSDGLTLEMVRDFLIGQEDTIIFCLLQRAKHPLNKNAYDKSFPAIPGRSGSFADIMIRDAESLYAKFGRYENPEEHPFFPECLPGSCVTGASFPKIFHPAAASINVNPAVWNAYFDQLLPLIAEPGDDGNYATTVACDLACLQALSKRIHYGKYVAEVKFRNETDKYEPAIRSRDREALMNLLTFKKVEEMVKRRVEKKAMTFGQEVTLDDSKERRKIDPGVVSRMYDEWVMPLTKEVEVEYLLLRLD